MADMDGKPIRWPGPLESDFSGQVAAAQELRAVAETEGIYIDLNQDGTVTMYHGTTEEAADGIWSEGFFPGSWFSHDRGLAERYAWEASGVEQGEADEKGYGLEDVGGAILTARVDSRTLEYDADERAFRSTVRIFEIGGVWYEAASERMKDSVLSQDVAVDDVAIAGETTMEQTPIFKYYSTQRPVGIGTYPRDGMVGFDNYDKRTFVDEIGREAWGELRYSRVLTEKEADDYELTPATHTPHERTGTERKGMSTVADDVDAISNVTQNEGEKSQRDILEEQLSNGIRSIMDSENFKNYLQTSSRLIYNNYSLRNTVLVWLQKPDASHVMGYEQWKDYGRNVRQGAQGAKILVPIMASEKTKGGLAASIRRSLSDFLGKNPEASVATHRLGNSKMEFTMNRANRLIGIKVDGKEAGIFSSHDEFRKYLDRAIIGKIPLYYSISSVFDANDVVTPEKLWVKRGFTKDEVVLDGKGNPIRNKRGETQIHNTPERQSKFVPSLDMGLAAQDPVKIGRLLDACTSMMEGKGVAVLMRNEDEDAALKGAGGYFTKTPSTESVYTPDMAGKYPKGLIVVDSGLEATERCAVMFHEMAHADLHANLEKLVAEMGGEEVTRDIKETQAQAVSYGVARTFGIESDRFSFAYLAQYTQGFELQDMQRSLDVITKEIKSIMEDLKSELGRMGLNIDLSVMPKGLLPGDVVKSITDNGLNFAFSQEEEVAAVRLEIPQHIKQYESNQELMELLGHHLHNAMLRQECADEIKVSVDALSTADTRDAQEDAANAIEAALTRASGYAAAFDELKERFYELVNQPQRSAKDDFDENPRGTIDRIAEEHPRLAALTEAQKQYIAKSDVFRSQYGNLLRDDIEGFVNASCDRAAILGGVAARNGIFVEIKRCEDWFDRPLFERGTLCHPKIADDIIKQAEAQIREMKEGEGIAGTGFVPYARCGVTVFGPTDGGGLAALNTRLDIGDGNQVSLKDHLKNVCIKGESRKKIYADFEASLRERKYADKIFLPSESESMVGKVADEGKENVDTHGEHNPMTQGEWLDAIGNEKAEGTAFTQDGRGNDTEGNRSNENKGTGRERTA